MIALAKPHRWQIVQWPSLRLACNLLARVFAPEAGLWAAVLCATDDCALASGCGHPSIGRHPAQPPHQSQGPFYHHARPSIRLRQPAKFDPCFRPQVSLSDGQITGMEALARWHHPSHGVVAPLTFLSSVAEAQLWHKLTDTILHDALSAMRDLEDAGIFVRPCRRQFRTSRSRASASGQPNPMGAGPIRSTPKPALN